MTWARSPQEEALLRRSLPLLADVGLPIAIADRGNNPEFTTFLEQLPRTSVTVAAGLVAQVQASVAMAAASEPPFILYIESDKAFFFEHRLCDFLERALEHADAGVVLASRSVASFETFPTTQRYTESVINELCARLLGVPGDYSYGPFLLNRTLAIHVGTLAQGLGWGWRHAAFRAAHRAGLSVIHLVGEYPCPPDAQEEDEDEVVHRIRQLSQNIGGLIA